MMHTDAAFSSETMLPSAQGGSDWLAGKIMRAGGKMGRGVFFADFSLAPAVGSQ